MMVLRVIKNKLIEKTQSPNGWTQRLQLYSEQDSVYPEDAKNIVLFPLYVACISLVNPSGSNINQHSLKDQTITISPK